MRLKSDSCINFRTKSSANHGIATFPLLFAYCIIRHIYNSAVLYSVKLLLLQVTDMVWLSYHRTSLKCMAMSWVVQKRRYVNSQDNYTIWICQISFRFNPTVEGPRYNVILQKYCNWLCVYLNYLKYVMLSSKISRKLEILIFR